MELTVTFVAFVRPLVSGAGHFEETTVAHLAADSHAPLIWVTHGQVADVEIVIVIRLVLLELFNSAMCDWGKKQTNKKNPKQMQGLQLGHMSKSTCAQSAESYLDFGPNSGCAWAWTEAQDIVLVLDAFCLPRSATSEETGEFTQLRE